MAGSSADGPERPPLTEAEIRRAASKRLYQAAERGDVAEVKLVIREGLCDVDSRHGPLGQLALHVAAKRGHREVVKCLVEEGLSDKKAFDKTFGQTAVHWAAQKGHLEVVKYLLEEALCGKEARTKTRNHLAAAKGHLEVVKYLLEEASCDKEARDHGAGGTALHLAASNGHRAVDEYLVEKAKCDAEARNNCGETPLHRAAWSGELEVVEYLVKQAKCNRDVRNHFGQTALHLAAEKGKLEVAQFLHEAGCEKEARDNVGETALHRAAAGGKLEVVKNLMQQAKCDWKAKDEKGLRALHWAAEEGHWDIVEFLYEAQFEPMYDQSRRAGASTQPSSVPVEAPVESIEQPAGAAAAAAASPGGASPAAVATSPAAAASAASAATEVMVAMPTVDALSEQQPTPVSASTMETSEPDSLAHFEEVGPVPSQAQKLSKRMNCADSGRRGSCEGDELRMFSHSPENVKPNLKRQAQWQPESEGEAQVKSKAKTGPQHVQQFQQTQLQQTQQPSVQVLPCPVPSFLSWLVIPCLVQPCAALLSGASAGPVWHQEQQTQQSQQFPQPQPLQPVQQWQPSPPPPPAPSAMETSEPTCSACADGLLPAVPPQQPAAAAASAMSTAVFPEQMEMHAQRPPPLLPQTLLSVATRKKGCSDFARRGRCRKGDNCPFSHAEEDMNPNIKPRKNKMGQRRRQRVRANAEKAGKAETSMINTEGSAVANDAVGEHDDDRDGTDLPDGANDTTMGLSTGLAEWLLENRVECWADAYASDEEEKEEEEEQEEEEEEEERELATHVGMSRPSLVSSAEDDGCMVGQEPEDDGDLDAEI